MIHMLLCNHLLYYDVILTITNLFKHKPFSSLCSEYLIHRLHPPYVTSQ